ncbi:MAG: 1-acyl-sn-glycerol-3-phosphate acyltransferase [Silvibacterium sp.]|nr:1-acyl-sn-glycerol-3-phosphate acyltransferase [Silvibacterium sp.]
MRSHSVDKRARAFFRTLLLVFSLLEVLMRFWILRLRLGQRLTLRHQANWLHQACGIISRRLGLRVSVSGPVPASGLIASNHLSHLDILLYAAVMPCIFISKSDVLSWPMFGLLARCGGTIFVDRQRRHGVGNPATAVASALASEIPVVLYPEGTSTDGSSVLPFHSSFFQPGVATGTPIVPAAISYSAADCDEADLCYYGDLTFFPHLLGVLGRKWVEGRIMFSNNPATYTDRKIAAKTSWEAVVSFREKLLELTETVSGG